MCWHTHPCPNLNGDLTKPPLKFEHATPHRKTVGCNQQSLSYWRNWYRVWGHGCDTTDSQMSPQPWRSRGCLLSQLTRVCANQEAKSRGRQAEGFDVLLAHARVHCDDKTPTDLVPITTWHFILKLDTMETLNMSFHRSDQVANTLITR